MRRILIVALLAAIAAVSVAPLAEAGPGSGGGINPRVILRTE